MRNFWASVKGSRRKLISAIFSSPSDLRPYASVIILGERFNGLLDSGATISCMGSSAVDWIVGSGLKINKFKSSIRTADVIGSVIGSAKVDVTFRGVTHPLEIYFIPSLSQDLYLGINFWRLFQLAPDIICGLNDSLVDPHTHSLTATQKQKLSLAIQAFPSFEKEGLGKTSLVEHHIDVGNAKPIKQRHFPISPAV